MEIGKASAIREDAERDKKRGAVARSKKKGGEILVNKIERELVKLSWRNI